MVLRIEVDDILVLKKKHPCGSFEWRVTRVGVDIGIKCLGCGRFVMIPRRKLERKIKEVIRRGTRLKPHEIAVEI